MELDVSRFFSDRVVWDESSPERLRVTNSVWDWLVRIISWIFSPASYTEENRRTIDCFKKYLLDALGPERLQRISNRYSLDLDQMEREGSPLLSRHIAQIVTGSKSVSVQDIGMPFKELTSAELAERYQTLRHSLNQNWHVPKITTGLFHGGATEWYGRLFFDPFLADRERLHLQKKYHKEPFDIYVQHLAVKIVKRDVEVGTLIPAPDHKFYYVSGKLVTGEGMVSYFFHPATEDTELKPLRIFRGTSSRNSEVDSMSSVITDLEPDLGRSAFESGEIYEEKIAEELGQPPLQAGHSLGAALVQYQLANRDHIEKAYLFSGPGIPLSEVEKFNRKNPDVQLVIRRVNGDPVCEAGEAHLGYRAPPNVHIHFEKHHLHPKHSHNAHVSISSESEYRYGIDLEMPSEEFYHKDNLREKVRSTFGPPVAAVLRGVRSVWRSCVTTRAETERGLKFLNTRGPQLRVDHFRPIP